MAYGSCDLPWLNSLDSPCHHCDHRHKGCHSECEDYKKSVEDLRARKKSMYYTGVDEIMIERSKKMRITKQKKQRGGLMTKDG